MSFSTPKTFVTGELITASICNTFIRDQQLALAGGYMAITSQAAGDVLYASSGTALARLPKDAGKYLKSGASAPSWETLTSANTDRNIILPITRAELDASDPPTAVIETNRMHLLFTDSSSQLIYYMFQMPSDYGSGLKLLISQAAVSATSGAFTWKYAFWALSTGDSADVNSASYDTANDISITVGGTAGYMTQGTDTPSNLDSLAANDLVTLKFYRDPSSGGDTAAGNAELYGLTLQYTAS